MTEVSFTESKSYKGNDGQVWKIYFKDTAENDDDTNRSGDDYSSELTSEDVERLSINSLSRVHTSRENPFLDSGAGARATMLHGETDVVLFERRRGGEEGEAGEMEPMLSAGERRVELVVVVG